MDKRLHFPWLLVVACGAAPTRQVVQIPVQLYAQTVTPAQIKSFELWIFEQVDRDGRAVDCDWLIARDLPPTDPSLIRVKDPQRGDFRGDAIDVLDVVKGEKNRLFYIELYAESGSLGRRVGAGCKSAVTIKGGQTVDVEIAVSSPPPTTP